MKKYFSIFFVFFFFSLSVFATHNKAGEITFEHITGKTYRIIVTTYTDSGSSADRPKLKINYGDGTSDSLSRSNGPIVPGTNINFGENIGHKTKKNEYVGVHTYPGNNAYVISMEDQNRIDDVVNISNSVNVPFYIQTILLIDNNVVNPPNNSPKLTNPPIDVGCVNKIFIHNAWAVDLDNDSLSYELDSSRGTLGAISPGYYIPSGVSLNPVTGDLVWNVPTSVGLFNFAFRIIEWRNGLRIGSVTRDLLVEINTCPDNPPVLQVPPDLCVLAGDTIRFTVSATDLDNDLIKITAGGATFFFNPDSSTFFQVKDTFGLATGDYYWKTTCEHIRKLPYQAFFKAEDNSFYNLVDFKTVNITVLAPPPRDPTATPSGTSINLSWLPSTCSGALGYRIYRRNGKFNGDIPCPCIAGVPSSTGFTEIKYIEGEGNLTYTDDDLGKGLIHGNEYCYYIVAEFPGGALSCASPQVCAHLIKDVPVITHVDILSTSNDGQIQIIWSKATEIDTINNPGPYQVNLFRSSDSGASYTLIDTHTNMNDTTHVDVFNTVNKSLYYKLEFFNEIPGNPEHLLGSSHAASSVFVKIDATDNELILSWNEDVPWTNYRYDIFRFNDQTSLFDSIGTSTSQKYSDKGLENGKSYCYKVRSVGDYSAAGFISPIINRSQEKCGVPIDNIPPCDPVLTINPDCVEFRNFLSWTNPNNFCPRDVIAYNLYYSSNSTDAPSFIGTFSSEFDTSFTHEDLFYSSAGCYIVTALDSASNESMKPQKVCVDNCPEYTLPNIFTPDGNGINDFFRPFPYRYIESIEIRIFNRWGVEVFRTEDPNINWDGTFQANKKACPDGVYFYTCLVNARRLDGINTFDLHGFFHIVNSGNNPSPN